MWAHHHKEICNIFQQQNLRRDRREQTDFQHCGWGYVGCTGSWSHEAQPEQNQKNAAFSICPATCKGFPRFAVCCLSLAMYVEMDDVHDGWGVFKCNFKRRSAQTDCPAFSACASWKEDKTTMNRRASISDNSITVITVSIQVMWTKSGACLTLNRII